MLKYRVTPVTNYQQNCSLVWCSTTNKAALIDPGGDIELLLGAVKEEGVVLEKILLTHGHLDHVGGAQLIAEQLNIPIIGPHQADSFWFERLADQAKMFGFAHMEPFMPGQWLVHGEQVSVGDELFDVLHCPGHTPGHIVFYNAASQVAFVGDVLFQNSVGRSDFPMGNHADLISSIKEKLLPLGDEIRFIPGHGPSSTFGAERRNNPYLV
ncbi:MAG: MBL fold metallo-hydrolase [Pseudomonadota bacterium]|nr:MBL fold metallo-hydrolase [Pseudomonadota bacterium]